MSARKPYSGSSRKLVMAFDVGTTFSGVSYCILDPGEVPEIKGVTRFPGQAKVGGDSKIPTILYYDQQGNVWAAGDEANKEGIEQIAEEEQWTKAEWFKLHLRPNTESEARVSDKIRPLPKGKMAIDVFADFLRYLYQCAEKYIEETYFNGPKLWESLQPTSEFVLSHPNGWEGAQQSMMCRAAVTAGLIPDGSAGQARLSFITEGEASLHFCIQKGLTNEAIKSGKGIIIVDAGGGTIDISAYKQTSEGSQAFEEIAAPQCFFEGSIFVTNNAKDCLENLLQGSTYLDDAIHISQCFDKTTKLWFRGPSGPQLIRFGTSKDKDPRVGIRSGQIRLNGPDVASFFEPSIQCIIESTKKQCASSKTEISSVFLVGGFAANEWLFTKLKENFIPHGLIISRPDSHVNKAVADGAVSFYIDHHVTARVAKFTCGADVNILDYHNSAIHISRSSKELVDVVGEESIGDVFKPILPKSRNVNETEEFKKPFYEAPSTPFDFAQLSGIGNVFNSMKGLLQSSKPVSSPIRPKTNPIPSAPSLVPPKRQNTYAGGMVPKIGHVHTRRISEMGPVGSPAKFSNHGEGGGRDDRGKAGLVQECNQEDQSFEPRRKIEKLRLEVRVLKEDKEGLKQQVLALQTQALEADKKYKRSLEKAKALQDENERLLSHINSITSEVATKEQAAARRITEIESRNQQQEEEIRTLRQRILQSDEKQVNTDRLLQARTADLIGVETFLTTADEYSGAEIMMMVESLNGEIFQISAFMAETLENESQVATPQEHEKNMTRFRKALEFSRNHIGANLFSHLKDDAAKVRADALPLQLGLQALLTAWCTSMVRSWISGPFNDDLQKLYQYIRNSDGQSIAGRWRAITCAQTRILASETQRNYVIDTLLSLMCLCGWSISGPDSQKVVVSLQEMVERIEKMWIQLKRATKEGITNTDMEVFTFYAGKSFGEDMEDMCADALGKEDEKRRRRERTLCTIAIGLRKTSVKRVDGGKPTIQADVLIKPKVALASVLLEGEGVLGEPRPRGQYFGK